MARASSRADIVTFNELPPLETVFGSGQHPIRLGSVRAMWLRNLVAPWRARPLRMVVKSLVTAAVFVALLTFAWHVQYTHPDAFDAAAILAFGVVMLVVGGIIHALDDATNVMWNTWAEARGFRSATSNVERSKLPIFRAGDEQRLGTRIYAGTVLGARPVELVSFTYTVRHLEGEDPKWYEQNDLREEHELTVARLAAPTRAGSFAGISCLWQASKLDRQRRQLLGGHTSPIDFESERFNAAFDCSIAKRQDQIAVRQLLDPSLLVALTEIDRPIGWQLVGRELVVFLDGAPRRASDLDLLCRVGALILARLQQMARAEKAAA